MPKNIQVANRIKLVKDLTQINTHFMGNSGIENVGEDNWQHSYRHFDSLLYYLLLTCFDILGQKGFVTFQDWLETKKQKK